MCKGKVSNFPALNIMSFLIEINFTEGGVDEEDAMLQYPSY